jgi:putative intracellular protease/amidase
MKKVLFVITSNKNLSNTAEKTGFWLEEFVSPYYLMKDNGIEITLASPKGGKPSIHPKSNALEFQTPAKIRFNEDKETQEMLSNTIKLETANQADYDAVFYPSASSLYSN